MSEDRSFSGMGWFVAGIGLGALVGILYAPKSGEETREELAFRAREGSDYLRARAREAADKVGTVAERSKAQVGEMVDRGRERWSGIVERGQEFVADRTTRVGAAVEAGREAYQAATTEPHNS